ncbi:MAG: hypothetical protein IJM34_03785 [Lachnospiraceae bacterium]|nr:hypothetical protein [Lachnospiraceae bacterium]
MSIKLIALIGGLILVIIMGGWYAVNPESVREFCRNHPEWDKDGRTQNSSDAKIRIAGIIFAILAIIGLFFLLTWVGII